MEDPLPEYFPIPRALVMKENLPLRKWDSELNRAITVRRIPAALPQATAYEIYKYLDHPANFKEPKPGESVTALELAPHTPTFSKENLFLLERAVRAQKELGMTEEEG
jgi:hypothetical protein